MTTASASGIAETSTRFKSMYRREVKFSLSLIRMTWPLNRYFPE